MTLINFTSVRKVATPVHLNEDAALVWVSRAIVPYHDHFWQNLSGCLQFTLITYVSVPRDIHVCYRFHRYNSVCLNCKLWFFTGRPGVTSVHHGQRPTHVHTTWPARYKVTCNGTAFRGLTVVKLKYIYVRCQWICIWHVLTLAGRHLSRMGYRQSISR
jgi:hypothetical protein